MKVNVTCAGCEVTVEEIDGKCVIIAMQDGEVVEEFTIECEGTSDEEETEVADEVELDDFDETEEEISEGVKSFNTFFKPKSTRRNSRRK